MKYDYHVNSHRKKRFVKKIYITVVAFLLSIIGVGIAIKADAYLQESRNSAESTTSQQTTGYFAPTTQIFRTPYFQFQTNKSWAEVPTESTQNKFVYRSLRNNIVEHELTVYINPPADLKSAYVVPVKLKNGGSELIPREVSPHCKEASGAQPPVTRLIFKGVNFNCEVDSTQYHVMVGLTGGSTQMRLNRPDGTQAVYTIFYRNVTAKPEALQLTDILTTFQTR